MKRLITFATTLTLAILILVPVIRAEDDATPTKSDAEQAAKKAAENAAQTAAIGRHIRALGSTEFDERDEAYEALKALGAKADPALKDALRSEDLQIKISAERLLAELRAKSGKSGSRTLKETDDGFPRARLEELMRRMVESGASEMTPEQLDAFRRAMELQQRSLAERLTKLREETERRLGDLGVTLDGGKSTGKIMVRTNDETLSYEKAEDGKVRVSIAKDGEEAKLYEAASLDELKAKHPEVYERVKGFATDSGRVTLRIGRFTGGGSPTFPFGTPTPRLTSKPETTAGRLGVHVAPVTPVLRAQLGLVEGVGLVVERVVADSIATRCAVKPWDVIVALDDKPVASAADVRRHLDAHDAATPVKVTVIRAGKRVELLETK